MPPVKDATEYKTPRQWLMAEFSARPRTIITLNELLARKSGWTEKQIRAAITNLRHEKGDQFPLRVAATVPRPDGRPGTPPASAWIYEPPQEEPPREANPFESFRRRAAASQRPVEEVETDLSAEEPSDDEGYRWTPLATATPPGQVVVSGGGRVPGLVDLPNEPSNGNGRRTYEELAVTRSGVVLVDDEGGEVYRLVKVLTAHPVDNDL